MIISYSEGALKEVPAVTRNIFGDGDTWCIATAWEAATLQALFRNVLQEALVEGIEFVSAGVEVVRRRGARDDYVFVINPTEQAAPHSYIDLELLTSQFLSSGAVVPAGGVQVIRLSNTRTKSYTRSL